MIRVGNIIDDVANPIGDFFTSVVDRIPGGQWIRENANSAVKQLAKSAEGRTALWLISQALTNGALTTLAPVVGPQAASVAFAIPGVIQGDSFSQAWLSEFTLRVGNLAKAYGEDKAKEYSAQLASAGQNTALTNLSPQGLETLMRTSGMPDARAALAWANLRPEDLALRYGGRVDAWAEFLNAKTRQTVYPMSDYALSTGSAETLFQPGLFALKGPGLGLPSGPPTGQGGGLGIFAATTTDQGLEFATHAFASSPNGPDLAKTPPRALHVLVIAGALGLAGYGAYRYLRR